MKLWWISFFSSALAVLLVVYEKKKSPNNLFMQLSDVLSAVLTNSCVSSTKEKAEAKKKKLKTHEKLSKLHPFCCFASENPGLCLDAEVALATGQLLAPSSQQSSSAASRGETPCSFNEEDEEDEDEDSSSPEWGQ